MDSLKEYLYVTIQPKLTYDGIQACVTYDPPGPSKVGITHERLV
jgi:hypothetical protein